MAQTHTASTEWATPTLFTYGFRPFFLGAGIWAVLIMLLWVAYLLGAPALSQAADPAAWHAHAFLFGYVHAAIAGFLLTAVPNWTNRPPMTGLPLFTLFALWVIGRAVVVWVSFAGDPSGHALAAMASVAMPICLGTVILRQLIAGRNWRNLPVLGLIVLLVIADLVFWSEAASGGAPAQGLGTRLGLTAILMLVALIGGRIVPAFTRNWLSKTGQPHLPPPPMQRLDTLALIGLLAALLLWVGWPFAPATGTALLLAGALHGIRLLRWRGPSTYAEPLVWVLHVAYAFVPLGALAMGGAILTDRIDGATAQHVWMAGALGLMTLAVMTRATLGHTGHPLTAGRGTTLIYLLLIASVALRVAGTTWLGLYTPLILLSGTTWIASFACFLALYGPRLLQASRP